MAWQTVRPEAIKSILVALHYLLNSWPQWGTKAPPFFFDLSDEHGSCWGLISKNTSIHLFPNLPSDKHCEGGHLLSIRTSPVNCFGPPVFDCVKDVPIIPWGLVQEAKPFLQRCPNSRSEATLEEVDGTFSCNCTPSTISQSLNFVFWNGSKNFAPIY